MATRGPKAQPIGPRLLANMVVDESGCWLWQGYTQDNGYGYISGGRRAARLLVHRASYEAFIGPIPDGLQVDHTCHNPENCPPGPSCMHRRCVNPEHLEAVTPGVNTLRSGGPSAVNARRTHCTHDHPFTDENTYVAPGGGRRCKVCATADARAVREKMKMVRVPVAVYDAVAVRAQRDGVSLTALVGSVLASFVASE